jgi:hypothetical protein
LQPRASGLRGTPAVIAAPRPLMLYNMAKNFPTATLDAAYKALKAEDEFQPDSHKLTDDQIAAWFSQLSVSTSPGNFFPSGPLTHHP